MSEGRSSTVDPPAPGAGGDAEGRRSTRERILDVALELFLEKGYDKTSLREIAEALGFSKAALYYHFESKEAIFMALHQRLHDIAHVGLAKVASDRPMTVSQWVELIDEFIDMIPANRKLIAMHERNRAAFEALHDQSHAQEHDDLDELLRGATSDPTIPAGQRLRLAFAFSGTLGALILAGDTFTGMPSEELVAEMKGAVRRAVDL